MKHFLVILFATSALAMLEAQTPDSQNFNNNIDAEVIGENNEEFSQAEAIKDDDTDFENDPIEATATKSLCSINMGALNAVINKAIDAKLARQPAIQVVALEMLSKNTIQVRKFNGATLTASSVVDTVNLGPTSIHSGRKSVFGKKKILAYMPKYRDHHKSGLAALFLNLEKLFPCSRGNVVCSRSTYEEDGFLKGKTLLQASDIGNHFRIFGKNVATYGMAISGCGIMNKRYGCYFDWFQTTITCLLPPSCR